MTHTTEQERAEFEKNYRDRNEGSTLYCESEWRGWQAARRAPAPQAQRAPLGTMQIIEEIRKSGFKKTISDTHLNIFRLAERAHGIKE